METRNRQLKILVDARLASAFKAACKESGIPMAKDLSVYMEGRVGASVKAPPPAKPFKTATRKDRRSAMHGIITSLAAVRDAEEAYLLRIPENFASCPAYEDAESAVCAMDEAIALLGEAYR